MQVTTGFSEAFVPSNLECSKIDAAFGALLLAFIEAK
jgi:hypothetical protein